MTELWTGLALGMAGSLHCVVMCGPLMLAARRLGGGTTSAIVYQLARIATYGGLGFAAGVVGRVVFVNSMGAWLSIACGVALLATLVVPLGTAFTPTTRFVTPWLGRSLASASRWSSIHPLRFALAAGALNALLPCGMVYIALTGALASHDPWRSSIFMLAFGAGTLVLLVAGSVAASRVVPGWSSMRRLRPLAVAAVAILLIGRGLLVATGPPVNTQVPSLHSVLGDH
jgi:sulfite exporter TauE/SafE